MKKVLALLFGALCTLAMAETDFKNVPPHLQKALRGNALKVAHLNNHGLMRLEMDKPEVTELVYGTFIFHYICADQWHNPAEFAKLGLTRVELVNANGSQGFAFDARGDVCEQMGQLGKNFRTFIAQRTVPCDTASCPRRP